MRPLWGFIGRIRGLFDRSERDLDLADELAAHLEMAAADYERRGLEPTDAARRARLDAGNLAAAAETHRRQRGLPKIESLVRTLGQSARALAHSPSFTTLAVLTLALGIGLATAVYTVADVMALRRLPVRDQGRIVVLWGRSHDGQFDNYPIAGAKDFARDARTLNRAAYFAWFGAAPIAVRDDGRITRLRRALVSGEFFGVLGTQAALGRALRATDDEPGAAPATVISDRVWRERYGGDASVLGRRIALYDGSRTYTIVGVMPKGYDYPAGTDFWAPIAPSLPPSAPVGFDVIGRLRPSATPVEAAHELSAYFARPQGSVWERDFQGVARLLPDLVLGNTKPALIAFVLAAALLLLITCVNVANLLLVRGLGRVREVAVRLALGASRGAVTGQLLAENALLAVAGGLLGIAVAWGAVHAFVGLAPANTPRVDEVALNRPALLAALAITGAAVLLSGLAPAMITARVELQEALRAGARQTASRGSRLVAEGLVAVQVALALVVLSAAASIGRTLLNLERAPLGFEAKHLVVGDLALQGEFAADPAKTNAALEALMPKIAAIPGVMAASPVVAAPFAGAAGWSGRPAAAGQTAAEAAANPILNMDLVGSGYFTAMGMQVLKGRGFTEDDRHGTPAVVVVSETAASYYWPNADPLGKRLSMGGKLEDTFTVVGVVPDTRYRELRRAMPSVYFPLRQSIFPAAPTSIVVRTTGPAADIVGPLRRTIAADAPGVALASAAPFDAFLAGPLGQPRLNAFLLGVFGLAAVGLSAIGLFGVISATVRQRTREIGVRSALGATTRNLSAMVLARGLTIAGAGIGLGIAGAIGTGRLLTGLLYGTSPTDPVLLAAACAGLLVVNGLATIIPARAAARVDVVRALRVDA